MASRPWPRCSPWTLWRTDLSPLCVDLDGTLIRSDLLYESAAALIRQKPWLALAMPLWMGKGRAGFKREIATRVSLNPALLPYDEPFLKWLREEHARHRTLVLATASDELLASAVARHVGIFNSVLGSDGTNNRKGAGKLAVLSARYGREFAYAGNSRADLAVWRGCDEAILVNADAATARAARKLGNVTREFPAPALSYSLIRQTMRARLWQWILTISIAPTMLTHNPLWAAAALASSCLLSGLFLTRDVLNLQRDRAVPHLATRPVANGVFPIGIAFLLGPALVILGLLGTFYIVISNSA